MPISGAILGSAVIGAGAALWAGNQQAGAAREATNTIRDASNQTRNDLAVYRAMGPPALNEINRLMYGTSAPGGTATTGPGISFASSSAPLNTTVGVPDTTLGMSRDELESMRQGYIAGGQQVPGWLDRRLGPRPPPYTPPAAPASSLPAGVDPRYASFYNSPDYQFAMQQGLLALDRSAASKGQLHSGGHTKDTLAFASGLAAQQYGNYFNRLMQIAGIGQNAAAGTGNLGATFAGQIANQQNAAGAAAASGAVGAANAFSTVPQNLLFAQMMRSGYQQPAPATNALTNSTNLWQRYTSPTNQAYL